MLVSEFEILMLFKLVHSLKVFSPMLVTELGMSMFVSLVQIEYLQPIVTQYLVCNKSEIWP